MNIAVNARFLIKDKLEGIGKFTAETFKVLVRQYPEHQFLFFFDRPYDESFVFAENVKPIVLYPPARHPVLFYIWFEWAVSRALRKYKADIFISTDGFLSLKTDVKTLLVIHDIAFKHFPNHISKVNRRYYDHYMPLFLERADKIVTVSNYSKNDLIEHYKLSENKIDVVYNGTDNTFLPLSSKDQQHIKNKYTGGENYFLYVGSVHPRKNLGRLLRAYDQFKSKSKSSFKLLIIGRMAWQVEEVREAHQKAVYRDHIIFMDYVSQADLPRLIGAAYAMTYVSIFEGFGIPLLEAMYCDVPSITSNISSMPEVVGDAGLLVDPYSIDSIAEGMLKMAKNTELRNQLIERGKIQRQKFSWEQTAQRLWQSVEELKIKR